MIFNKVVTMISYHCQQKNEEQMSIGNGCYPFFSAKENHTSSTKKIWLSLKSNLANGP